MTILMQRDKSPHHPVTFTHRYMTEQQQSITFSSIQEINKCLLSLPNSHIGTFNQQVSESPSYQDNQTDSISEGNYHQIRLLLTR